MGAILLALAPLLTNLFPSLKTYFDFKNKEIEARQALELAKIEAAKQQIISSNESETAQVQAKLGATSQDFKQYTFYFLAVPMLISVFYPSGAAVMWHNFELVPEWFRTLFGAVYLTIWGIPVAANYIGGIFQGFTQTVSGALDARAERQVMKIKALNDKAVFDKLRETIFKNGLTQGQVDAVTAALRAGENE